MTTSALLFGAGLLIVVAFYVTEPFRSGVEQSTGGGATTRRERLLEKKGVILAAIREIDADVLVGKLEPADHRVLRQRYVVEGAAILKELDALQSSDAVTAAIESDLARIRSGSSPRPAQSGGYCHQCGSPVDRTDKFCAKCGAQMKDQ